MLRKFLFVAAVFGLVLALEGNLKLNSYAFMDKTNSMIQNSDTYEAKSDNYRIENVCVDQLNEQIRLEMFASISYMNMVSLMM